MHAVPGPPVLALWIIANRIKLVFSCWIKGFPDHNNMCISSYKQLATTEQQICCAEHAHPNDFGWHVPVCWLLECALYLQLHKLNWQIVGLKKKKKKKNKRRRIIIHYSCGFFFGLQGNSIFVLLLLLLSSWSGGGDVLIILRFISKILYEDLQWCHHVC